MNRIQRHKKTQRTGGAIMSVILPFVSLATLPLLFQSCDNGTTTDEKDMVKREFTITRQFYYLAPGGSLTQYYATVTIVDQTGGSTSLEDLGEHNIVSNFHQMLDILVASTETELVTSQHSHIVLPRGVRVNIVNSAQPFDFFQALNSNTVRVHTEWLSSIQNIDHLNIFFKHSLSTLAGMAHGTKTNSSNDVYYE